MKIGISIFINKATPQKIGALASSAIIRGNMVLYIENHYFEHTFKVKLAKIVT